MTDFRIRKKLFLLLLVGALLCACSENRAMDRIKKSGTITVITRNNAHCYYTYRDQEMGFEFELAKAFADYLGVGIEVKVCESWGELLPSLDQETGDFVAASMTITPSRRELADFSNEYLSVQQMVITHKDNLEINSVDDLAGKTIRVRAKTSYEERLKKLKKNRLDITTQFHHNVSTEEIIEDVAQGRTDVTIADSNVALLNRRYYPDIRIAFPIGEPQSLGWAVKKGEGALLDKINTFFDKIKQNGTFDDIYKRYYAYVEKFDHLDIKKFQQRIKQRLPKYEHIIKKASERYGFDWRLVAALIYQESQFNPRARSFTGVRGLMQLTLPTAQDMGIENRLDPEQSIMGGVRYLRKLHGLYDKAQGRDRLLIALAAYNVGKGHVQDARRLASKMKLDPNKWSSLEQALPLLSNSRYYKKTRYGYCRGSEPVFHVQSILTYYDILKREAVEYASQDQSFRILE
jgi:membrane-bound lytic murein transglycosylase F